MSNRRQVNDTDRELNSALHETNSNIESSSRSGSPKTAVAASSGENESDRGQLINGEFVKSHGLHWFIAALFLVGDVAGGGIVALPTAVQQCSFYAGLALCLVMAVIATTSAVFLGKSWEILLRHWPEYHAHCRKPYAELGFRALGKWMKVVVSVTINVSQFGSCVVFFLLISKNIHDFVAAHTDKGPDFCIVILIVAVILLPIIFLKSPEDFWWVIVAGMASTALAVIFIIAGTSLDIPVCAPAARQPRFQVLGLFTAIGTLVFTFGGHAVFPTIQHDMKRPSEFTRSSVTAFIMICTLYAPVIIMGHIAYGDSLRESVINSIQTGWIQQTVNLMIAAHCLLTLTLLFNPLNQELEELFKIPQGFGVKRVILRVSVLLAAVFVAESVPNFGSVMNLIGATTIALTCIVFPPLFYLFLSAREKKILQADGSKEDDKPPSLLDVLRMSNKFVLVFCIFITIFGIIGGGAATYSAVCEIASTRFEYPCYVKPFVNTTSHSEGTAPTNCCGASQTLAVYPNTTCNNADTKFYGKA